MRVDRRTVINTVAFVVAAAGLFAALALRLLPQVFRDTYSVYGIFQAAGGVFTNQEVTYRGVQVGLVGEMSLTPDAVKIEMVIDPKFRIPREGTRARILYKSAVGEQFIDLLPETAAGPYFQEGDVIPIDRTAIPIQTEDLLRDLDSVLASVDSKALGTLVDELGGGLGDHGDEVRRLVLALDTLASIGSLRASEITAGLAGGAGAQAAFNTTSSDFVRAAGHLSEVTDVLTRRRSDLRRTLGAARTLDAEFIALLAARKAEIDRVLADAGTATRLTHAHLAELDLLLDYLDPMLRDVVRAYGEPFFSFNVLTNSDGPACTYDPSSRPVREVTDDSPEAPETEFECAGASQSSSGAEVAQKRGPISGDGLSWLSLYLATL